eukprot:2726798-Pleurochrysis_carterae.AAC.1
MGAKTMWLGDTGAGMYCVTDASLAVKGSLRTNTTVIVISNGTTTGATSASHNLISLGRLAMEAHVGLHEEAKTGTANLLLPEGHVVPLPNVG